MSTNIDKRLLSFKEGDSNKNAQFFLPNIQKQETVTQKNNLEEILENSFKIIGEIKMFAGAVPPVGYELCQGQTLLVDSYPKLFAVIGNTYGGDGITDFNLPDLKTRVPVGSNGSTFALADTGGNETITLTEGQLPPHDHNVRITSNTETAISGEAAGNILGEAGASIYNSEEPEPTEHLGGVDQDTVGNGDDINIMQPYLVINYIIAVS